MEVSLPVEVPLRPLSKREVKQLEVALVIGTVFREDVMKALLSREEVTTWLDSLAVAASALAMEKAGYPVSKIAEELGRTEATIRKHLKGETRAGQLVRETYQMLARGELRVSLPTPPGTKIEANVEELKKEVERLKREVERLAEERERLLAKLKEALGQVSRLEEHLKGLKEALTLASEREEVPLESAH